MHPGLHEPPDLALYQQSASGRGGLTVRSERHAFKASLLHQVRLTPLPTRGPPPARPEFSLRVPGTGRQRMSPPRSSDAFIDNTAPSSGPSGIMAPCATSQFSPTSSSKSLQAIS